jgi:subtilisin-like proprotein convertase family protein
MSVLYPFNKTEESGTATRRLINSAARLFLPFLILIFSTGTAFSQLPNKADLPVQEEKKPSQLTAEKSIHASGLGMEKKGVDKPVILNSKIFTNAAGDYLYTISVGDIEIITQFVGSPSDNKAKNKTIAEAQAALAMEVYRKHPSYSKEELKSEILYQAKLQSKNNSANPEVMNSQNVMATCNFSGTLQAGDPQITGRIFRDGVASTCAAPKTCPPGTPFGAGTFNYDTYSIANGTGSTQCVTVGGVSGNGEQLHIVAYLGSFDPLNQCQNYLADQGGSSIATPVNFSFNLANGAVAILVCYNPINGATTTPYSITVDNCPVPSCFPITITGQPVNASACPGTNATFNVSATAPGLTGLTYNWQEDRGAGFTYLSNGGVYSGVNTESLQLTGVTPSMNGYKYRCVLFCTAGGLPVISNETTLSVLVAPDPPLVIPSSAVLCVGGSVQLNVLNGQIFNSTGGPITINTSGPATPYPSAISVSGLPVGATIKSVSINGISHTWSDDVDILLQSPLGTNVVLMSDVGSSADFVNHFYTFDDGATANMTTGAAPASGTYKPTNIGATDTCSAPLPASITQAAPALSMFGAETNGTWNLFVRDDVGGDGGTINSWSIIFQLPGGATASFSPATGLFNDAALTSPYVAGTFQSTVYAAPTSTTNYSAQSTNGSCLSLATSVPVTVNTPPAITGQPVAANACVGGVKTFSVTATGTSLTYQWQVSTNGGTTYTNVGLVGPYTGNTTNTLTISGIPIEFNNNLYRCVVSGACTPSQTSNGVALSVNTLPVVSISPGTSQCSPVLLTASGADTYSWSPAGGLSGTTGATVTATVPVNTTYMVTGTNATTGCSNVAYTAVLGKPLSPTISPSSATICLGGSQLLAVSANPSFSNTGLITIPAGAPGTTSGIASPYPSTLNVAGLPASGVTVKSISINGLSHTFPSDLDIVVQSPSGVNVILMSDAGSSFDLTGESYTFDDAAAGLLLAAYNASGTYRPTNITTPDDFPAPGPGSLTQATPTIASFGSGNFNGTWRLFIVDDAGQDVGQLAGGWTITFSTGASLVTFSPTTGLFTDAGLTTAYTGTPVSQVYASPAVTTTYTVASSNDTRNEVTINNGGSVSIPAGTIAVSSGIGGPYPSVMAVSGIPVTATVKAVTLNGMSHSFPSDIDILLKSPTGTFAILMSDVGGGTDIIQTTYRFEDGAGLMGAGLNASGKYRPTNSGATDNFAAPGPGSVTQATPTLASLTGDPNGNWELYVVDDLSGDVGVLSGWSITFDIGANTCISPSTNVTITVHNPIVFTTQPQNRTVCQNGSTTFTVSATGTIQTTQWQVSTNGGTTWTNVSGATGTSLTVSNIQTSQNGHQYRCVMSNAGCGSVNSNSATLTVNPLPTVSLSLNPAGQTQLRPGMLTTVTVNSSPAGATYQWFVNGVANPGITGSSYTVDAYHLGTYSVRVTDVNGCVNTTAGVTFEAMPSTNLFIYPNPTSGAYYVTYYMPAVGSPVTINVIDMKGRTVVQRFEKTSAPYTRFDFSASGLPAGVYVIEFRDPGGDRLAAGRLVVTR